MSVVPSLAKFRSNFARNSTAAAQRLRRNVCPIADTLTSAVPNVRANLSDKQLQIEIGSSTFAPDPFHQERAGSRTFAR